MKKEKKEKKEERKKRKKNFPKVFLPLDRVVFALIIKIKEKRRERMNENKTNDGKKEKKAKGRRNWKKWVSSKVSRTCIKTKKKSDLFPP